MTAQKEKSRVPNWAWLVAFLFYPGGMFVMLGAAKVLRWSKSWMPAIGSYATHVLLVWFMNTNASLRASPAMTLCFGLGALALFLGWGVIVYRIGLRKMIWTRSELFGWRLLGWSMTVIWFVIFVVSLGLLLAYDATRR